MTRVTASRTAAKDYFGVERRMREFELTVLRRVDGLRQGSIRGRTVGPGSEPGEGRPYRSGDDVRRMDWKLSARMGAPHVRDVIADRELEVWFVVDRSRSLDFGSALFVKRELALGAVAALGFLTARSGGRVGAVVFGDGPPVTLPARSGRDAVRRTLLEFDTVSEPRPGPASELTDALRVVRRVGRRAGAVVVVSDFLVEGAWETALRGLRARHELVAVEVVDPLELELPAVGRVVVSDPETGRQVEVPTTSPALRARYAELTAVHRAAVADALAGAGADHVVLRTDTDWVVEIARFLARRRVSAWLTAGPSRALSR
jgi:uncharacterized protein (DUF58 family)